MAGRVGRTSIEKIRRRDLAEAAYQIFLEQGIAGMTMARIGECAGMSHGIVNYYFKSKDALLDVVVRRANFDILTDTARRLRVATSPRERVSAVIAANFTDALFTRDVARAWASYYAAIGQRPEFERLQRAVDRRLASNLRHALAQLVVPEQVGPAATRIALLIDGLWLRRTLSGPEVDAATAISLLESHVDQTIALSGTGQGEAPRKDKT